MEGLSRGRQAFDARHENPAANEEMPRPGECPSMKKRVYNICFTVFFLLSGPYYFLKMVRRRAWRDGFDARSVRLSSKFIQAVTHPHVLWIHAFSVVPVTICTQ